MASLVFKYCIYWKLPLRKSEKKSSFSISPLSFSQKKYAHCLPYNIQYTYVLEKFSNVITICTLCNIGGPCVRSDERAPRRPCPCRPHRTDRGRVLQGPGGTGCPPLHRQHLQIHPGRSLCNFSVLLRWANAIKVWANAIKMPDQHKYE